MANSERRVEGPATSTQRKQAVVAISGKVLCLGDKAVKLWTPAADVWIPYTQILAKEAPPEADQPWAEAALREGEQARLTIPWWLARKKGLVR